MATEMGRAAVRLPRIRRSDIVVGAIMAAAIVLFVAVGSAVLAKIVAHQFGDAPVPDRALIAALILNIALILIVWRRHDELATEIEQLAASEARAHQLASRDPLTGLYNRRGLGEEAARLIREAQRRGKAVALAMIDLDNFKTVNDRHGHVVGDAVLRQAANVIRAEMPAGAIAARFGGDEFACACLFEPKQPGAIAAVAERLVSRLAQPFAADGHSIMASASIGIARTDADGAGFDGLLRAADIALYVAKDAGRNGYRWFDRSMEERLRRRDAIEAALRDAIPAGRIAPVFEPQTDLETGDIVGFEVLARWRDPVLGEVPPEQFVPVAAAAGLIGDLSLALMRQAFAAARDWDAGIVLAVNLTPAELRDPWLAQKIIKLLTETGFPASRLEVEITEAALFESLSVAQSNLGSLKQQGAALVIDEFGTGYSSLAHLRALPFDRIKIDRSFVGTLVESAESQAVVNAIARLGDSLNLAVTAVGIESAVVGERIRTLGCRRGQGHFVGRPVTAATVRQHLAQKRRIGEPGARRAG